LTKRGNGTLTLSGIGSAYTGPTVVTGGALNLAQGAVASLNNLTLDGGALGLAMSYGSGTFYAANVNLAGNSALNVNYDLVSGTPATALMASGNLTAAGLTVFNVTGYGFTAGQQFPLVTYTGAPLANLNNFSLGVLPIGVAASLSNNVANNSIDLVITTAGLANWIPLVNSDGFGSSSFNSAGNWLDGTAPSAGNGYFTRNFTLRSPADKNAYTFGGDVLAIDAGGQLLFKGTDGQVITINNLVLNNGLIVFGVSTSDNFVETLAGNLTLQAGTSTLGANGSAGAAETLNVTAPISGGGNLQISDVSADIGTIVLAANNTYTGTTTVARGTLLVNGSIADTPVTVNASGTLGGTGSIGGAINVQAGGTLAPGITARGALANAIGTLTAGSAASVSGTVVMKINRDVAPNSDRFVAPGVTLNPGATLTVNNLSSTSLVAGDTFTLFSAPVSGAFTTVNLPALPDGSLTWTNRLAIDGTIAVVGGTTVNPNSPVLANSVADGNLTLSWPADHTGWTLQVQTNSLGEGLGTNWVDVPGSASTNAVTIPVTSANEAVFYRLKL
jgi:autotransporter-associated beta strand protein